MHRNALYSQKEHSIGNTTCSHQELVPIRNLFPSGTCSHQESRLFSLGTGRHSHMHRNALYSQKEHSIGNTTCSHQELVPIRNLFPSGTCSHQESRLFFTGNREAFHMHGECFVFPKGTFHWEHYRFPSGNLLPSGKQAVLTEGTVWAFHMGMLCIPKRNIPLRTLPVPIRNRFPSGKQAVLTGNSVAFHMGMLCIPKRNIPLGTLQVPIRNLLPSGKQAVLTGNSVAFHMGMLCIPKRNIPLGTLPVPIRNRFPSGTCSHQESRLFSLGTVWHSIWECFVFPKGNVPLGTLPVPIRNWFPSGKQAVLTGNRKAFHMGMLCIPKRNIPLRTLPVPIRNLFPSGKQAVLTGNRKAFHMHRNALYSQKEHSIGNTTGSHQEPVTIRKAGCSHWEQCGIPYGNALYSQKEHSIGNTTGSHQEPVPIRKAGCSHWEQCGIPYGNALYSQKEHSIGNTTGSHQEPVPIRNLFPSGTCFPSGKQAVLTGNSVAFHMGMLCIPKRNIPLRTLPVPNRKAGSHWLFSLGIGRRPIWEWFVFPKGTFHWEPFH